MCLGKFWFEEPLLEQATYNLVLFVFVYKQARARYHHFEISERSVCKLLLFLCFDLCLEGMLRSMSI